MSTLINWTCALSNYVYIDSNRQVTPDLAPNYGDLDHDWHLSTLTVVSHIYCNKLYLRSRRCQISLISTAKSSLLLNRRQRITKIMYCNWW